MNPTGFSPRLSPRFITWEDSSTQNYSPMASGVQSTKGLCLIRQVLQLRWGLYDAFDGMNHRFDGLDPCVVFAV